MRIRGEYCVVRGCVGAWVCGRVVYVVCGVSVVYVMCGVWTEHTVVVGTSPGRIVDVYVNATGCEGPDIGYGRAPLGRIWLVAYTTASKCMREGGGCAWRGRTEVVRECMTGRMISDPASRKGSKWYKESRKCVVKEAVNKAVKEAVALVILLV